MKILNLYFKNINSLEGENRIDFERPPFSDTGVFAITGPNGSGKSSILDAITLALYGETFRFDKPAQHIITQHTHESFSQIEFALGQNKYRSSWQVKRENGNVLDEVLLTEMELYRLDSDGESIAKTPQEVCAKIADITGMNFRSFTRSIMLAQGDFAAFLNALDSERMAILEKIIGSDIYEDYQKDVHEKLAEAEKNLTYLHQDLTAVPLIEPESFKACELDLADFNEQIADYQNSLRQFNDEKNQQSQMVTLQNQRAVKDKALQEAIAQREILQKKLDQLVNAETAMTFEQDIQAYSQQKQHLDQENSALSALQNELKQIENTLALPEFNTTADIQSTLSTRPQSFTEQKQAIDGIRNQVNLLNANWQSEIILLRALSNQITEKQAALDEVANWLEAHSTDNALLENFPDVIRLKDLRMTLADLDEKKLALSKWSKSTRTALDKNKANLAAKNKKLIELNQKVAEYDKALIEVAQGNTLEDIVDLQVEQKERVKAFEELMSLSIAYENLSPQKGFFFSLFGKKTTPDRNAEDLEAELESHNEQLRQEENIRLALEKAVSNDALLARMLQDRNHLVDGKPCPLCGSAEHPYATRPPVPANAQQALLDQRVKIKRLTLKISELSEQVKMARKYAEKNHARINQTAQVKQRWLTVCNQLNTASADLDITSTSTMKRLLRAETTESKNIAILLVKYKGIQKKLAKTKAAIEKNTASIGQLQGAIQTIESEWHTEPQRSAETEEASQQSRQEEQALLTQLTEQLVSVGEELPAPGKESALADRLTLRRQEFEDYFVRSKNLTNELELLLTQQAASQAQIDSNKARVESFSTQLHTEEMVGLHLALVEKQKLIADKSQDIKQLQEDITRQDASLSQKMQATPFNNLEEISQLLAMQQNQSDWNAQKEGLDQDVIRLEAELSHLALQLENYSSAVNPEQTAEAIDLQIKATQEKLEIATLEARRLAAVVSEQQHYQEKHAALLAKLESQQDQVQRAKAEVAEITAENGMAFRRRVQIRLVERLLSQTNATLEKISGRYYVRHQQSERGLALEIEDTYQANVRRFPKTLSGGESFIVSLALALGLSELANNGKSIDSLFLDEGFGNLDAETLYTVINTLESLQAHGKTVGVISHVETVQKRFKAQLQLVKKPNGLGELKRVS